ncbi:hypothetical protein HYH02_001016 [Chlamydomonas schloesseri]|uniref:Uncharacterized protein n=1 Tax=Chlamydomonas schloesseri TaxID=2026947 RepID=A0A835WUI6_9CHLO|nr:hypothetical protein HYH02_001016 [Chlamydomonas schloesseri]|eukprot:KAG2453970.1 hypothetical protein HYH02_001016 [Chlamydomonas schloesseri]
MTTTTSRRRGSSAAAAAVRHRSQAVLRQQQAVARHHLSARCPCSSAALMLLGLLTTLAVPATAQLEQIDPASLSGGFVGGAYNPGAAGGLTAGLTGLGQGLNGQGWVGQGYGMGGGLVGVGAAGVGGGSASLGGAGLGLSSSTTAGNVGSGGLLGQGAQAVSDLLDGLGVPPVLSQFVTQPLQRSANAVATVADALTPLNLLPGSEAANSKLPHPLAALLGNGGGSVLGGGGGGGLLAMPQSAALGVRQLTDGAVGRITSSLTNRLFAPLRQGPIRSAVTTGSNLLGSLRPGGGGGLLSAFTRSSNNNGNSAGSGSSSGRGGGSSMAQSAPSDGGLLSGLPLFGYFQLQPAGNWAVGAQQQPGRGGGGGDSGSSGGGLWTAGSGLAPVGAATARDWQGFQGQLLSDMAAQNEAARRQLDAQSAALQDLLNSGSGNSNNGTAGTGGGVRGVYDAASKARADQQYEQMLNQVCNQWGLSRYFANLSSTLAPSNGPYAQLYDSYSRMYGQSFQGLSATGQQYLERLCCDLSAAQQAGLGYGDFMGRRWGSSSSSNGGAGGNDGNHGGGGSSGPQPQQQCDPRIWLARAFSTTNNSNGNNGDGAASSADNGGNGDTGKLLQQVQSMQQAYQDWNDQVIQSVPGLALLQPLQQQQQDTQHQQQQWGQGQLGQRLSQQWTGGSGAASGSSSAATDNSGLQQQQALQQAWEDWQRWVQGRGGGGVSAAGAGGVAGQLQGSVGSSSSGSSGIGSGAALTQLQTRAAHLFSSAAAPPYGGGGRRRLRS